MSAVKNTTNIILSIVLICCVFVFSSFKTNSLKEEVKKEVRTDPQKEKEEKQEVSALEYEATVSSGNLFSPLLFADVVPNSYIEVKKDDIVDFNFDLKSQEFYRIFYTHIISKNAP